MANQQGDRGFSYKTGETTGRAQMVHDDYINQVFRNAGQGADQLYQNQEHYYSGQGTNPQQAGGGVMNMAQEAAQGAANLAKGAATAVKDTLGMGNTDNRSNANRHPSNPNTRI